MAYRQATIANYSKKVSLRRCPWDPIADYDVIKELKPGDKVTISTDHVVYDWVDHRYYEVFEDKKSIGYIRVDAVTLD